jgi:hypothetical protein
MPRRIAISKGVHTLERVFTVQNLASGRRVKKRDTKIIQRATLPLSPPSKKRIWEDEPINLLGEQEEDIPESSNFKQRRKGKVGLSHLTIIPFILMLSRHKMIFFVNGKTMHVIYTWQP